MSALPDYVLEHRIDIRPILAVPQPTQKYGTTLEDVHALVVMKEELVVDARVGSETKGAEIKSSAHVLMQAGDYVAPGSLITIYKGTPAERTAEVVSTAYLEHSIAPSSAQAWLV